MARRKLEEHTNRERWLVSYADFITLLFAFFVVMYSISSVNEGKYRVLSHTLEEVFLPAHPNSELVSVGDPVRGEIDPIVSDNAPATVSASVVPPIKLNPTEGGEQVSDRQRFGTLAAALQAVLIPYIEKGLVEVSYNQNRLEIDMKSKLMFESGSVHISQEAFNALRNIGEILKTLPNVIHVEGHTDDVPISNLNYPSNWELSSARAASVVNLLVRTGVDPTRIAAIGYGQFQPIADNREDEGRQKNRRVTLVVLSQAQGANAVSQPVRKPRG